MMKNAIFIADTRPWAIGTLLLQVQATSPNLFDEAIIFQDGITEADMVLMKSIMPCRFISYTCPLPQYLFENYSAFKHFTPLMFARYEMFNYLNEFDNLLCERFELPVGEVKFYKNAQGFLLYLSENKVIGGWEVNDVKRKNFYYKLTDEQIKKLKVRK